MKHAQGSIDPALIKALKDGYDTTDAQSFSESYDFKTCQRSDGTTYGTAGDCTQLGSKEVSKKKSSKKVESKAKQTQDAFPFDKLKGKMGTELTKIASGCSTLKGQAAVDCYHKMFGNPDAPAPIVVDKLTNHIDGVRVFTKEELAKMDEGYKNPPVRDKYGRHKSGKNGYPLYKYPTAASTGGKMSSQSITEAAGSNASAGSGEYNIRAPRSYGDKMQQGANLTAASKGKKLPYPKAGLPPGSEKQVQRGVDARSRRDAKLSAEQDYHRAWKENQRQRANDRKTGRMRAPGVPMTPGISKQDIASDAKNLRWHNMTPAQQKEAQRTSWFAQNDAAAAYRGAIKQYGINSSQAVRAGQHAKDIGVTPQDLLNGFGR